MDSFRNAIDNVSFYTKEELEDIDKYIDYMRKDILNYEWQRYFPHLSRDCGGDILNRIVFKGVDRRDEWWKPFTYCYETQITMFEDAKALNLEFFSDWTLEEVEKYMEDLFDKMNLNYYETWSGERRIRV